MKIKKWILWIGMMLLTAVFLKNTISVRAAEAQPMIRVGLTENLKDQDQITLKNTMLTCGYWSLEKNSFVGCEVFTSKSGLTFTTLETTCFASETAYNSYDKAAAAAKQCTSAGIEAYPAILHENYWKVYLPGNGENCQKAANLTGTGFLSSTVTIRYRMLVTGDFGSFIIDVDDARNYPMFAATSSNSRGVYTVNADGKTYRGYIEIGRYGDSGVTAVNILPLEEYLYGVVPEEVSYNWPEEALKAQAVAARSYAAAQDTIGPQAHVSSGGYKLEDTTASQVYGGYSAERTTTTQAVNATKNEMIYYNGSVIKAYYFSTSGGSTEDAQAVWNVPIHYFRQVSDVTELSPAKKPWIEELTATQINKLLTDAGLETAGYGLRVTREIVTESARVYSLRLRGTAGTTTLQKTQISSVLGLPSTKFTVVSYGDIPDEVSVMGASQTATIRIQDSYILSGSGTTAKKASAIEQYVVMGADNLMNYPRNAPTSRDTFYFAGMGYGHGIGMSQSGAYSLAEEGYDYKQILLHYYTDVEIR
jgi:stage II sporulation protein D